MSELLVVIEGETAGRVLADSAGKLTLRYEERWIDSPDGYPLSVNLPLARVDYPQRKIAPYLWNLLPENPAVLQRWGQQYQVSPANPFKLLTHVGMDVPGAAQFIPPSKLEDIQGQRLTIDWLSEDELAERLRQLRDDATAVRRPGDLGKLSLPGAQAKTAFYRDERTGRWGVPSGRTPTTHIIKPCVPGFAGLVENEHLCLSIASRAGLPAARSFVLQLDQPYIVVERYDRLAPTPALRFPRRVHQEDMCQALGLMPTRKYQEDGGPTIPQIAALLRRVSSEIRIDIDRFLQANMLNWLLGGTDAHAKNYSLLIGADDEIRLAPLYDISSQLPYPDLIAPRLAMKIGDHYDIGRVVARDWQHVAQACGIEADHLLGMLREMAGALPDHIVAARDEALAEGLAADSLGPLSEQLIQHVRQRIAGYRV